MGLCSVLDRSIALGVVYIVCIYVVAACFHMFYGYVIMTFSHYSVMGPWDVATVCEYDFVMIFGHGKRPRTMGIYTRLSIMICCSLFDSSLSEQ